MTDSKEDPEADVYSISEAKDRFGEVMRRVRAGETLMITRYGKLIAVIRPVPEGLSLESGLDRLRALGILSGKAKTSPANFKPVAHRPGALADFLASRDE